MLFFLYWGSMTLESGDWVKLPPTLISHVGVA